MVLAEQIFTDDFPLLSGSLESVFCLSRLHYMLLREPRATFRNKALHPKGAPWSFNITGEIEGSCSKWASRSNSLGTPHEGGFCVLWTILSSLSEGTSVNACFSVLIHLC